MAKKKAPAKSNVVTVPKVVGATMTCNLCGLVYLAAKAKTAKCRLAPGGPAASTRESRLSNGCVLDLA